MRPLCTSTLLCFGMLCVLVSARAQQPGTESPVPAGVTQEALDKLLIRLAADESRIKELEEKLTQQSQSPAAPASAPVPATAAPLSTATAEPAAAPSPATAVASEPSVDTEASADSDAHAHMVELPGGGPTLKIRGFFDFNFGVGTDANPLIFPLGAPAHSTFQMGEFDLMTSSKLSDRLSFMSEIVFGTDATNTLGIDIERFLLSYKASKYFEAGFGRYHTSIGYYSTAFHHGTWFQTATGRPFMYFFEDSGGLLPVHSVGVSLTGLVPGTDSLGLHWVAEIGNGRASSNLAPEPVQNFYSDRNHKAYNLAAYIAPEWLRGLQVGGSYYRDRITPPGITPADQSIGSLYAVYITPTWEFMNEGVLLRNHVEDGGRTFNTPLAYTQLSRKFGAWRPYFRYQYVNSPANDPINIYTGRYMGPSVGMRWDFSDYAAFKLQYNRLDQRSQKPGNGLDAQLAFTF